MPGHRKRRQFKQTDAFTRGMVIGMKRAGWSIRQIAADTHLGASTVHRLNVGATRVTSARVDRRILRQAVAAPQATCTAILQHVPDSLDHTTSTRTISRRLVANGLHSCRPLRRLPLTPPNRRQRLEWCRARSTWMTEWHRVVFSDESRFCLSSDSRRVRVWRRRGERSNPAAIVERPTVRQRGIMVWGAIAHDSRSPLLRIQGTMTAQRYVDDVLRPQDNARPHTARITQQALQYVQMLPWPPYSPDLSPIEHVWDIIGRRLHALPQPRSEDELWQMVEREWRAIPQDAIRTLIDSLPRRVAACIAVREFSSTSLHLGIPLKVLTKYRQSWSRQSGKFGDVHTKNEDTVALRKFRKQIKVELGAKDGYRSFLIVYMVNEEDLGDNRRELALRVN
ncbi:Transposase [Cordylochernes scorpioides]|uniref:Transposase n=1 Tax=Cordylochernes scorpioides TaxID=51811 RepID=A0ABY6LUN5_9ARAC|nr:Transposase [Cordylochernes scorpioides]